jgi:hypothetical protein
MTFLTLSDATAKFGAFWMYAVCSLVGWLFIYARLPETRGLTLEQIQDLFESNSCTPGLAKTRPHAPPFAPLPPLNPFNTGPEASDPDATLREYAQSFKGSGSFVGSFDYNGDDPRFDPRCYDPTSPETNASVHPGNGKVHAGEGGARGGARSAAGPESPLLMNERI